MNNMRIVFSSLSLTEVKNIRKKSLLEEPGTLSEKIKLAVRDIPLFGFYLLSGYAILFKVFTSNPLQFNTIIGKVMQLKLYADSGYASRSVVLLWTGLGYFAVIGASLYISMGLIKKIYKGVVYQAFFIQAPRIEQNRRNREFYEQTEHIESNLKQQDKIRAFVKDNDVMYALESDNSLLEITVKRDGYSEKLVIPLSEKQVAGIREDGALDFSDVDNEWQIALSGRGGRYCSD